MDYLKHYDTLCISRFNLNRIKGEGEYFELHHWQPKSVHPEFAKSHWNLVLLTAREHYVAHWLLWKGYEAKYGSEDWRTVKMARAFFRTTSGNPKVRDVAMKSRAFEISKVALGEAISATNTGREVSEETRNKLSISRKGAKMSEKVKTKLRKANLGKTMSDSAKLKMSVAKKGKKQSEAHAIAAAEKRKGNPLNKESIDLFHKDHGIVRNMNRLSLINYYNLNASSVYAMFNDKRHLCSGWMKLSTAKNRNLV